MTPARKEDERSHKDEPECLRAGNVLSVLNTTHVLDFLDERIFPFEDHKKQLGTSFSGRPLVDVVNHTRLGAEERRQGHLTGPGDWRAQWGNLRPWLPSQHPGRTACPRSRLHNTLHLAAGPRPCLGVHSPLGKRGGSGVYGTWFGSSLNNPYSKYCVGLTTGSHKNPKFQIHLI